MDSALGSCNFNPDFDGGLHPAWSRVMQLSAGSNLGLPPYDIILHRSDEPCISKQKGRRQLSGVIPMSITDRELCREAIRRTLRQRAGDSPDVLAIAKATSETWMLISAQLIPVIGGNGVDAILNRALYLTRAAFPWLTGLDEPVDHESFPLRISMRMAGREPFTAAQASSSLFITFIELLSTLIGNSLTNRLLAPVCGAATVVAEQEKVS